MNTRQETRDLVDDPPPSRHRRDYLSSSTLEYALVNATLPEGFTAIEFPVTVYNKIRSILSIDQSRCLVLESLDDDTGNVVLLEDSTGDGDILDQRRIVATAPSLNHGMTIHNNYLYASSDSHVYRWPYDPVAVNITGDMQIVIDNINANENGDTSVVGHWTRTLIFDNQDRLLVSVGSIGNIDNTSFRARIRRFVIPNESSEFPLDFVNGEVFADGVRNEVGLAWDRHGILWGVQTGPDRLNREDLGGAIINEDNPAELLHAFRQEGLHYGYPYCWMEYKLPDGVGLGPGTMWTWPTFMDTVTDADCRNTSKYMPAELPMQGHSSPLGLTFYEYKSEDELVTIGCSSSVGAFPQWMDGYAFIAFHGSWNRQIPTGYKVVYVPINVTTGQVAADDAIDLLAHSGTDAKWSDGFRPVDVKFDECGRLLVSSDGTDGNGTKLVRIDYSASLGSNTNNTNITDSFPVGAVPTNRPNAWPTAGPTRGPTTTITLESAATSSGSLDYCVHGLFLSTFICIMIARGIIL